MSRATIRKNGAAEAAPETPSAAIVQGAAKTKTVVDALGRTITVRKFSPLMRMKLAEIIGNNVQNQLYLGMAALAYAVIEIDGEKINHPTSKRELEAMVQRLDEDGISVIQDAMAELNGVRLDEDGNVVTINDNPASAAKN